VEDLKPDRDRWERWRDTWGNDKRPIW
jgi:hypothetical protein